MGRPYGRSLYIMAGRSRRIHTDVTNNLERPVAQHKFGQCKGFTQPYGINRLVYFEVFPYITNTIPREKEIKGWGRAQRVALIERENLTWDDLSSDCGKPVELLKPVAVRAKAHASPARNAGP
jgi:putative endonuclease